MGWAKYFEDNVEIMLERQFMMQSRMKKALAHSVASAEKMLLQKVLTQATLSRLLQSLQAARAAAGPTVQWQVQRMFPLLLMQWQPLPASLLK